jgi:hypothetical protein
MGLSINTGGARGRNMWDPSAQTAKVGGTTGIEKPFSTEEAQSTNKNVSAATSVETAKPASSVRETTPTADKPQARPEIARPMEKSDIVSQLLRIQKPPSPDNIQILTTLLQYGLEASGQNFEQTQALLKGRNSTALVESSVASLSKGLGTAPKSVEVLANFLKNPAAMTGQLQQAQVALRHFQQAMSWGQQLFDPGLMAGLASILTEMDDQFKRWTGRGEDRLDMTQLQRAGMIQDGKALMSFLSGLQEKLLVSGQHQTPAGKAFLENLGMLRDRLGGFTESLLAHEILSVHQGVQYVPGDNYLYFQVPNMMSPQHQPIELLFKKTSKNKTVNPEKTTLVLKCVTPDMGEVAVVLDVDDKNLAMTVYSDKADTRESVLRWVGELKTRFESLDYHLKRVQTLAKKLDIKRMLLPLINLNTLSRISTEA